MSLDAAQIPMLSRHASSLLRLSEESRDNIKLLGLLAVQDPVAIARILALANSASLGAGKKLVADVERALTRIGSMTAYDILVKSALLNALASESHPNELDYLARHIFSLGLTARRIASGAAKGCNFGMLTLLGSVEKLGLAWLIRVASDNVEAADALSVFVKERRHVFRGDPLLLPWLMRSTVVAEAWGLTGAVAEEMNAMVDPNRDTAGLSVEACCLLLAEQYLELVDSGLSSTGRMLALEERLDLKPTQTGRTGMVLFS